MEESARGKSPFWQYFGWPLWDGGGVPATDGYLGGYQVATVCKRYQSNERSYEANLDMLIISTCLNYSLDVSEISNGTDKVTT